MTEESRGKQEWYSVVHEVLFSSIVIILTRLGERLTDDN